VQPLHRRPSSLLTVAAGGLVGTAVRELTQQVVPTTGGGWPAATLLVNLVGALVLGALLTHLALCGPDAGRRRTLRLLLGTGFCGGLTTMSSVAVEVDLLVRGHDSGVAVTYALVNVLAGVACAAVGAALAGARATRPLADGAS